MGSIATAFNAGILVLLLLCLMLHDAAAEWLETAKLTDSDGEADDRFGVSVAIDNGILVVGAYGDEVGGAFLAGSATILEWSDSEWVAPQQLTASDAEAYDQFGVSAAISNGTVAVGVPGDNDGGLNAGAVYTYEKGADGLWTERQKLIHSDAAARDWFGWSLAMQGNTLIVGARLDDLDRGSVYVYTLLAGTLWTQAAKLTANDRSAGDVFGHSVAIDADTILIGARFDDDLGSTSGSAYVFQRDGEGGSWTQVAKLTPSDGQAGDWFGTAVAIEGGTIFVGSDNNVDGANVGAVYQFGKEGGTWTQQSKLVARDFATDDRFGRGLALRNGTLVVGAYGQKSGAVYVFQEMSGVFTQRAKLVASDGAPGDWFGYAVVVDDEMVIAGALGDNVEQGSVYAFEWHDSESPSIMPTYSSVLPTSVPTVGPSESPSKQPSFLPTSEPSVLPSVSAKPTTVPTAPPTEDPSETPSDVPSTSPSLGPSREPSGLPSAIPSGEPSGSPSFSPSRDPSAEPTITPSVLHSRPPSLPPSRVPSSRSSFSPSGNPSVEPTAKSSAMATSTPTGATKPSPSSACTQVILDSEEFAVGDTPMNLGQGITVRGDGNRARSGVMIFDTSNPSGGDEDLASTNLGKIMILPKDRSASSPSDNPLGGFIRFSFDPPATYVATLDLKDFDTDGSSITGKYADGSDFPEILVEPTEDGGEQTIEIGEYHVSRLRINLAGEGGIDNLKLEYCGSL